MRSNIAGNLHEQVNTALSNINILSDMAKLKADTEPKKSKEFIEQIHSKSGNMMTAMDDMLWAISPENDSMEKVLERVQEHLEVLKSTCLISINILVDEKVKGLKLNMKKRQDIFWFLKSGVTNMARTGANEIKMHIATDKAQLIYTLEFNNSMMDMQQLNNLLQRQELENKLKDAKAKMTMHSVKSNSVIELKIPVV
jgi:signal transduction histidine kinase